MPSLVMILQALNDLYSRLAADPSYEIAPPGFSPQKISFRIRIRPDGSLVQIEDARTPDEKGKLQNTVMLVPGEAKPSGAGINPGLLWDNQTYLLGRQPEDKAEGFGQARFEALRQRHLEVEKAIDDPAFSAVCRFLEGWSPEQLTDHPILNDVGTGFGIFALQGEKRPVHEVARIKKWWTESLAGAASEETEQGQCLLSGAVSPIARLHPKIKGVTGAQSAGASLVSFNASAYESYAKSQSYNAPVSETAAFQYGTALNSLLTGPHSDTHRIRIGDTTTVFWTDKPTIVEDIFADILGGGSQAAEEVQDVTKRQQIRRLLEAIRSGGRHQELGEAQTAFYILGLAPNAARVSIRFFHRSTVADLIDKLHGHHRCFEMVRQFTEQVGKRMPDPEFPAIWQILRETARVADEIPPLLGGSLARAIIEGTPYPEGLFAAVIRRIHADRTINYLRAATLKAVLVRNHKQTIPVMLDTANTEPAYLLGRLFAALEKTQEDALGSVNAGLRDKYYSAASATPASVFPRILRTYPHHLSKLGEGAKIVRDRLVQDILGNLDASGFPNQFPLKKQGIFAIGYYHQRKDFFTKRETTSETETTAA
ncbi:type I-C CRISPR-associated protein Cas8c/Csd1 [Haloferula sargassicola]|uniref:Type I-C CRISPR-associated protein Cas8c/Csd1 n=1 Tax=Haloferula sargassicola TaxID=490096 RepID=A0ABP9UHN0_9BACT